jgi:predicted permease
MNFFQQLETRLRKLPGVESVAISDSLPPGGWHHDQIYAGIRIEGRPLPAEGTGGRIAWRWVTPEYFSALDIPVVQGRGFSEHDRDSPEHFIIVSQSLARYMFPNEDPVGHHLQPGLEGPWYTVIGVAADVKNGGLTGAEEPEYYRLRRNQPEDWDRNATVIVKTAFAPATTGPWIRDEVASLDNAIPVQTETMSQRVSRFADRPRFEAALLSFFALAGVLLAAIGLYGLISFLVVQRTAEIGVRMALGASKGNIVRLMASQGVHLIAAGTFIGLVTAFFGASAVSAALFQVRPTDPLSLLAVALLLAVIAGVATCVPALRATNVQPMDALRHE